MKRALVTSAAVIALAGAIGVTGLQSVVAAPRLSAEVVVPARVDNFQLTDHQRMHHELYYYSYAPAIALMTYSNGSDFSAKAAVEFEKLAAAYKDAGVLFLMMNSDAGVTREQVAKTLKASGVSIPVMMDELQLIGDSMGVKKEGEVFVLNPRNNWEIAYHGPLDNRFTKAKPATSSKAKTAYAANAISAVIAGGKVEQARVEMKAGKTLAFQDRGKDFSQISYAKDVAPIIEEKCASCHVDGGIAPFAMNSYEIVKGFGPMIRESIRTDRMPPYFADPHIGTFKSDQSLSPAQTKTLIRWLEAGAPRGAGADPLKTNVTKAPEWPAALGEPDLVVTLPAFNVPATGVIDYVYPVVDNPFKGDTWLRGIVVAPGDRSVVHHVTSGHVSSRDSLSELPGGSVGSYTPGAEPQIIAADAGAPVPAGGKLRYSMHYTTVGKPATDVTKIGYYLHTEKPKYVKRSAVIGDFTLEIPPGEQRYTMVSYLQFPADAYLYTLYPHAHYRGTHVELTMVNPDGSKEILLSLPKYDFNWQRDYDPVDPIHVKAGAKLQAKWVYDNSPHNKANPDPTATVLNGDQTFEEMMYFRVNYRWADETSDNIRNDLQQKLMSTRTMGALDDNMDGLVQKYELTGSVKHHQARFAEIDLDGNGGLDEEELRKGGVVRVRSRDEREGVE